MASLDRKSPLSQPSIPQGRFKGPTLPVTH
jgi:hypothetical protein